MPFFVQEWMPVVVQRQMQDRFSGLNVQKTVGVPQLQFLTVVVAMPVEIPQAQFLDKVYMSIVVSGAVGQTVQKTCGDAAGAVLGQGVHARCSRCVWCRRPRQRRKLWSIHSRSSWTRSSFPLLLCLVPMARQRRKLWSIHSCSSLTRSFFPLLLSGADGQTAQKLWRFHSSSSWTRLTCPLCA